MPLSVPVLYLRLNVDMNKCKHEPGSKIAHNINLKTTQSVFFLCPCSVVYSVNHVFIFLYIVSHNICFNVCLKCFNVYFDIGVFDLITDICIHM